jgi:hypothetical protein
MVMKISISVVLPAKTCQTNHNNLKVTHSFGQGYSIFKEVFV